MNTNKKAASQTGEALVKAVIYIVLIALAITIIVPVAWVFMASVKQNSEFYGNPWALPLGFYWQNFVDAWNTAKMGEYMLNSVIVTILALLILLALIYGFRKQLIVRPLVKFIANLFMNNDDNNENA